MTYSICAVVVTHNRLPLLQECISSLRNQTEQINSIIVVNNGSTDGTTEWLNSQDELNIYHQTNLGGAGGFHRGIKEAYIKGYEWIWVMDDDVIATQDCLSQLLVASKHSLCLHPLKRYKNGPIMPWESLFDPHSCRIISLYNKGIVNKPITFTNVGNFEGMLIHRNIIEKIGLPDKRFFICGDDLLYGYLASFYTNVCLVKNSILIRNKESICDSQKSDFTLYYTIRNFHLIHETLDNIYPETRKFRKYYFIIYVLKTSLSIILDKQRSSKIQTLFVCLRATIDFAKKKTYNTF